MPGPVPKRSTERRRRNKPATPITKTIGGTVVEVPPTPEGLHPIAARWFESLGESGQAKFYEPSDWLAAEYVATAMTKSLWARKFSSVLFASVWSAMTDLLTTEGARRKARMEIEREAEEADDPAVTAIDDYRKRLAE